VPAIVGASGNVGAVAAGLLLWRLGNVQAGFSMLGMVVLGASLCAIAVRFSAAHKVREQELYEGAMRERAALAGQLHEPLAPARARAPCPEALSRT